MSPAKSSIPEARRAYHRELRSIARTLRLTGFAFALLGIAGLVLGLRHHAWWVPPSWVSFALGCALILTGVVRRARDEGKRPDEL